MTASLAKAWSTIECTAWLRIFVAVLAGGLLSVGILSAIAAITVDRRPPVTIDKVETLNSPLPQGGQLRVRVHREKARGDCPVHSERYASDRHGRAHEVPDVQWAGGPINTGFLDLQYDVSALPPGSYTLHVSLMYHCPGQSFPIQQPPVLFTITE